MTHQVLFFFVFTHHKKTRVATYSYAYFLSFRKIQKITATYPPFEV